VKLLMETVGLCLFACLGAQYAAADEHRPEPEILHDEVFVSNFDAVCGLGSNMSKGCDAIRAREIVDAASVPWRAIGRVNFASTQISQHCTGTLVAERIVLTAAHCLYNFPRKSWIPPQSIVFAAGFQRGSAVAVSHVERFILNESEDASSRDFRPTSDHDWALLVLEDPLGREVGYLDVSVAEPPNIQPSDFMLAGYSGLRPNVLSVASDCGQPSDSRPGVFLQLCSAMQGDSGAPLLVFKDGKYAVAGVFSAVVGWEGGFASLAIAASSFSDALRVELRQMIVK
jgi:protease YdgD